PEAGSAPEDHAGQRQEAPEAVARQLTLERPGPTPGCTRALPSQREGTFCIPYNAVMTILMPHRLFTVHDYHQMAKAGILTEDDRVELIEGEIVEKAPIGSRHGRVVDRLNRMFVEVGRDHGFIARVQGAVRLDEHSEPQPDIALLRLETQYDDATQPAPDD